jgi:hypothetical protein
MLSHAGAAILGNRQLIPQKITLNVEDVILHEEKLNNIMEVSPFSPTHSLELESQKRY